MASVKSSRANTTTRMHIASTSMFRKARTATCSRCLVVRSLEMWNALLASSVEKGSDAVSAAFGDVPRRLSNSFGQRRQEFPPGPWGDQALRLGIDPLSCIEALTNEYGSTVGFSAGGERVVLTREQRLARRVLIEGSNRDFVKEGTAFFPDSSLTGKGLLTSDGETWRRQRAVVAPAFTRTSLAGYHATMWQAIAGLFQGRWAFGGRFRIYPELNQLTLRIITEVLFGEEEGVQGPNARQIQRAVEDAFRAFSQKGTLPLPEDFPTPANAWLSSAVNRMNSLLLPLIRERRELYERGSADKSRGKDLLDRMVGAAAEDKVEISDWQIRDEVMTLIVAGQETSAILLAWAISFIARNPSIQGRLRKEAEEVALQGGYVRHEDIDALEEAERVILETMRLRPPAYMVGRCCKWEVEAEGFRLQPGDTVLVAPYLMHKDEAVFERPLQFVPDRWKGVESPLKDMGPGDSFLPFGAGPRNCIGAGFAMNEAKLFLASLILHFDVMSPRGEGFPRSVAGITLRPEAYFSVELSPRRPSF